MKEVICIHLGQAGVQLGDSLWELFCLEHNIKPDGQMSKEKSIDADVDNSFQNFFKEFADKAIPTYIPRSVYLDLDPASIDEVRTGPYRKLYDSSQFVSGKEDAASNFARGRCTIGNNIIDKAMDRIQKLADDCASLHGIIVFNSVGGGTGSGLGSLVLERLADEYKKEAKIGIEVYPSSQLSCSPIEFYNSIFSSHYSLEHQDLALMFENEALHQICQRKLNLVEPTHKNLNRLITNIVSCNTSALRFKQSPNSIPITEYVELVPFPRLSFTISSCFPFWPSEKPFSTSYTVEEMTFGAFKPDNFTVTCNPQYGKYTGVRILYRGDFLPRDINAAINSLKATRIVNLMDWAGSYIRIGLDKSFLQCVPEDIVAKLERSVCTLSNSTELREVFERYVESFDDMFAKRAFIHWYTKEGLEEGEFIEAREDVAALMSDYEEILEGPFGDEESQYN